MNEQWNWDDSRIPENDKGEEKEKITETAVENKSISEESSYHWVNPEYQKRQAGISDDIQNSYENNSYKETIGENVNDQKSTQQTASEQQNPSQEYRGGSYKEWRNQDPSNKSIPTGQRQYGTYFHREKNDDKNKKIAKKETGFGKRLVKTVVLALVFGVVAGGVMFGVNSLGYALTGQNKEMEQIPTTDTPDLAGENIQATSAETAGTFTVAQVAQNCMPSVVSITNASVQTVRNWFGGSQQYESESSGSGIIVGQNEKELLIATNKHVVEGADTITVAFCDDSVYEGQIKGKSSENDLAVVAVNLEKVTKETLDQIKIIALGDSDAVQIGEQVVAIGNALGYGQSVTSGYISAVNREMTDETGASTGKLIQTDAAINPGNSGGALLNMRGELIGINSAKSAATAVEGMGYAIPVAIAEPILDELMNRETRYRVEDEKRAAYIGVTCMNVEATAVQLYGIPGGAFVSSVEDGGPAEQAGIQKGDVITKFDGAGISSSTELVETLTYYEAGEVVEVVICRAQNGEYVEQTVSVTLGKKSKMTQTIE